MSGCLPDSVSYKLSLAESWQTWKVLCILHLPSKHVCIAEPRQQRCGGNIAHALQPGELIAMAPSIQLCHSSLHTDSTSRITA